MSKWGITADLQFDLYPKHSQPGAKGITTRLEDALACWDWIVRECMKRKCEALWVIGDIFEARTAIDVAVLDAVCRDFARASKRLPLKLLAGNHDSYLRSPERNSLQVFKGIADVYDSPGCDAPFAFLPWCDDHDKLRASAAELARVATVPYLLGHVLVEGAVPKGKGFPLRDLCPDDYQLVLLGDVHNPVELSPGVRYVGSPMQIDYRDAGQKRGFAVLDDTTNEVEFVENKTSPRFHIVTDAVVEDVNEGDFTRVHTDDEEIAVEAVEAARAKGAHVETTFVPDAGLKPRLDVRASDEHEKVLRRYTEEHWEGDEEDWDAMVALGLELLAEAKDGM